MQLVSAPSLAPLCLTFCSWCARAAPAIPSDGCARISGSPAELPPQTQPRTTTKHRDRYTWPSLSDPPDVPRLADADWHVCHLLQGRAAAHVLVRPSSLSGHAPSRRSRNTTPGVALVRAGCRRRKRLSLLLPSGTGPAALKRPLRTPVTDPCPAWLHLLLLPHRPLARDCVYYCTSLLVLALFFGVFAMRPTGEVQVWLWAAATWHTNPVFATAVGCPAGRSRATAGFRQWGATRLLCHTHGPVPRVLFRSESRLVKKADGAPPAQPY